MSKDFPAQVLRDYVLLADGERGALIGPEGNLAWMCAPHWDSDAVFSSLIGGGGVYAITPAEGHFVWGGHYEDGSLIWHSRWVTTGGVIECREALAFPGDPHTAVILRRVIALDGEARLAIELEARADFARETMADVSNHGGLWAARSGSLQLRWSAGPGVRRRRDGSLSLPLCLDPGAHHDLMLEISDRPFGAAPISAEAAWDATEAAWARAVPDLSDTVAPRDARRAYSVLRGLTSAGGGMVAAATMSLPERAESGRNYDYRYAWLRDQCYAGEAVRAAKPHPLLDEAVAFVRDRVLDDGPTMKPAYRSDGGSVPDERILTHLVGYPGGFDRVGNWVNQQFQLDVFGEALLLFATAGDHDHLGSQDWLAVEATVAAIEARWDEPDAGIWELDNHHWAHSRLTCVAGLRAIAAHAPGGEAARWSLLADAILADVSGDCTHPSGLRARPPAGVRHPSARPVVSPAAGQKPGWCHPDERRQL